MMTPDIRAGIFAGESGGDYNALFGFSNRKGPFAGVNVTDMTVNDVLAFTDPNGPYGQWVKGQVGRVATPVGAYQVVGSTLREAVKGLGLTGNERFDQATQDAIGNWIYQTQGTGAWEGYRGPRSGGGNAGGAPMGLLSMSTSGQPEERKPFGERVKESARSGELWDNLAVAFNSLRMNPDPNIAAMADRRMQRRDNKEQANRTAAFLRAMGTPQALAAAAALESGTLGASEAFQYANQKADPWGDAKVIGGSVVVPDGQGGFKTVYQDAQAGGDVTYGLTPQRYVKPDGTVGLGVLGNDGTFKDVPLPNGAQPAPNVDKVDAGDRWLLIDQMGNVIGEQPKNLEAAEADKARGAELGKAEGAAAASASGDIRTAETALSYIDSLKTHPGRVMGTGASSWTGFVPGTNSREFQIEVQRLASGAFMTAIQELRGLGALSNSEGQTATAAVAALATEGTEEGFLKRLKEYEDLVRIGLERARSKLPAAQPPQQGGSAPAASIPSGTSGGVSWRIVP